MSAKIQAAMAKINAQVVLIADKFANGGYESEAELQTAMTNIGNAETSADNALAVVSKVAKQGRKGLTAMATTSFDKTVGAIQQLKTAASLLKVSMQAELDEMEESKVTEDIVAMDFDEEHNASEASAESTADVDTAAADTAADADIDVDHNGTGDVIEQEDITPTDHTATEAVEIDDKGAGEVIEVDEIVPTDLNASEAPVQEDDVAHEEIDEAGNGEEILSMSEDDMGGEVDLLDLGSDNGDLDIFEEEEVVQEEVEVEASADKAALRASATAQATAAKGQTLEACWNFSG